MFVGIASPSLHKHYGYRLVAKDFQKRVTYRCSMCMCMQCVSMQNLWGLGPYSNLECSEIASEIILGQKQSYSSY